MSRLIYSSFAASAGIVYVGAHDKTVEGSYVWVDNTVFEGTWGEGQPNNLVTNGEDQDCVIMESAFQYDFSDIYCSYPYKFLCQIKI